MELELHKLDLLWLILGQVVLLVLVNVQVIKLMDFKQISSDYIQCLVLFHHDSIAFVDNIFLL